jgi:dual specificity protein kinase YAK1
MDQWQSYSDSAGGQRRYNGNGQMPRESSFNGQPTPQQQQQQQPPQQQQQQPPPAGFKYDQYQGSLSSHGGRAAATSPITTPQIRDNNGDVSMHDAHDYNAAGIKYPMRPHHHHQLSGGGGAGRPANLHSPAEPSSAAQRYSPMEVLSPTSPYSPFTPKSTGQPHFAGSSQRQSPTRQGDYAPASPYPPQSPYYAGRQQPQQLPPITPLAGAYDSYPPSALTPMDGTFSADPKSPRRVPVTIVKGPVPELKKIRAPTDLHPKVNAQPAFRRANPEGGFISVCTQVIDFVLAFTDKRLNPTTAAAGSHGALACDLPHLQPSLQI